MLKVDAFLNKVIIDLMIIVVWVSTVFLPHLIRY